MIDFHIASIIGTPINIVNRKTESVLYQNSDMGTLGQRLKACRKESGLKQAEVCSRIGIGQGTLSELENDKYPTSSFVPHFAALYGVEALWLAEGRDPKSRGQNYRSSTDLPIPTPIAPPVQDPAIADLASLSAEDEAMWRLRLKEAAERSRAAQAKEAADQAEKAEMKAMMQALLNSQRPAIDESHALAPIESKANKAA